MVELIEKELKELKPYARNARKNDGKAVEAVIESIKQCGYITPIIVDEEMVILAGHTRFKALSKMGVDKCKVVIKRGLTEDQKRKYRILDNRTNEVAAWDYNKLMIELDDLDLGEFAFGFEKLTNAIEQNFDGGFEYSEEDFGDEQFKHECPECGFRFN